MKSEYPDLGVNLPELLCILGVTVALQTGQLMWRAGRDQRKGQTNPDWQVAILVSKETYFEGLFWWPQDKQISISWLPHLKSLYIGPNWVLSHIFAVQVISTHYFKGMSLWKLLMVRQAEGMIQGQEKERGISDCLGPIVYQLVVVSS